MIRASVGIFAGLVLVLAVNAAFFSDSFMAQLSRVSLQRAAWLAGAAVLAFAGEALFTGWKSSSLRAVIGLERQRRWDLLIFVLDILSLWFLVGYLLSFGTLAFAGSALGDMARERFPFVEQWSSWPLWARALGLVLTVDFFSYWIHRALHGIPALWELHRFHHSADRLTLVTARRDHPIISQIYFVFLAVPMAILGPEPEALWLPALISLHAMLVHSALLSDWGWLGRWVLISPAAHRIHHARAARYHHTNFGGLTPIWDRAFGTRLALSKRELKVMEIGDSESTAPTLFAEIWKRSKRAILKRDDRAA